MTTASSTATKTWALVPDVFNRDVLESLGQGNMAGWPLPLFDERATAASSTPSRSSCAHCKGTMALAHNGNLVNAPDLRRQLEMNGAIFHTTNDSEVISYIITRERLLSPSIEEAVAKAMYTLKGAYSLIVMSPKKLIAARDPNGFRPLCVGKTENGYAFASESCAFDSIGAQFLRDVEPGEIVVAEDGELKSIRTHCGGRSSFCVFEYVYFARPDSVVEGVSVHEARQRAGGSSTASTRSRRTSSSACPIRASTRRSAIRANRASPYGVGFIKNRYVGRTFIQPTQGQRENAVRIKLNVIAETVKDKRVVLIDDSIVRGTTWRADRQAAAGGGRQGGALRRFRAALPESLLLRYRHRQPRQADRLQDDDPRDCKDDRRRLPPLPERRGGPADRPAGRTAASASAASRVNIRSRCPTRPLRTSLNTRSARRPSGGNRHEQQLFREL